MQSAGAMQGEPLFAIPTCRLRDVGEAVEAYDGHFAHYGHSLRLMVFDDSSTRLHERYFSRLASIKTRNELSYVGPAEKAALKELLTERLGSDTLSAIVGELFRPSYGGNRNFTLLYSLGSLLVSADDDMRPYALVDEEGPGLELNEVCRGKVVKAARAPRERRTFDVLSAFLDALGKTERGLSPEYARGELLIDTATDLETNTTRDFTRDNRLLVQAGDVEADAIVKMAQTFRSGTNDIDALDFIELFLEDESLTSLDTLADVYVLGRFRPAVTNKNWRMDCGVAAYDNLSGLPPFFPTRLRFEDYIYRLWIQQPGVIAAHVAAAQNHGRSPYLRNPPASEILNEEIANLLKRKIRTTVTELGDLGVSFDYDGEVDDEEAAAILERMGRLHSRVTFAAERATDRRRADELVGFKTALEAAFCGFEFDFFQHTLHRALTDTVRRIKGSLALWPTLLEICDQSARHGELPQRRIGLG
jgi:hypothetical protein